MYRPCLLSTFCEKNNGIHAILRLGKKGGGGGLQIHLGALGERAIENNEVFSFLYFYSSQKIQSDLY